MSLFNLLSFTQRSLKTEEFNVAIVILALSFRSAFRVGGVMRACVAQVAQQKLLSGRRLFKLQKKVCFVDITIN